MDTFPYKRVSVIGTTSSGKSTLAEQLAAKIGGNFVELDALYWEPNWIPALKPIFWERVEDAVAADAWVIAGNYNFIRPVIWQRAEVVIWLDYPLHIVFWRLLTRTIRRSITKELLWNTNREKFWPHLKLWSDDSLFHWLFKTYWRRKRETPKLLALPEYAHLKVIHFMHPKKAECWLKGDSHF